MDIRNASTWEQMLRADEVNHMYFAERAELPGVSLFCTERDDAPEFDVGLIYTVSEANADDTLLNLTRYYRDRGRRPRVRLTPLSTPAGWPKRLERAGFVKSPERFDYLSIPPSVHLPTNPAVRVEPAVSLEDADRFSEIQVAGYSLPAPHGEWDRQLARRHVAEGRHTFYLGLLDGKAVGAARCVHTRGGVTVMAALATVPAARGRGVGTSLLARMAEDARAVKSRLITGTVVSGSYAARMYRHLGFEFHFGTESFIK